MTRTRAPVHPPVVTTIAGSDSGGGAGIQADLKTIEAGGGFGTSVVTAVTAQHTRGVESSHLLPREEIEAQLAAVWSDFDVEAIKTGMLGTREIVDSVTEALADVEIPVVVDPVMVAGSGDRLFDEAAESAYETLAREATLITPNAREATVLTDVEVESTAAAQQAGEILRSEGLAPVLVTGGHLEGEEITDVLVTESGVERFRHPCVETPGTHGSGCTLSAAIATRLAHGDDLVPAVRTAIDLLDRAVRYGIDVGEGPGPVHHMVAIRNRAERDATAEAVSDVVQEFVARNVSPLVPEVGMNVVGATPYAESPNECAAVEGRIGRTREGVAPTGGVRFDASSHVARFLLAAREFDPDFRFALNCRFDERVESVLESVDWPVTSFSRGDQPADVEKQEASTMEWSARQVFERETVHPVVIFDRGAHGKEPMTRVLAGDSMTLVERTMTLLNGVESLSSQ